jgi:hypothetical protein
MNLELTIQDMFNNYPTLFKERSDCLDHLFCTIGNGYHWHNGELCSNDDDYPVDESYLEYCLVDGKAYQHNKLSLRAESQHYENERIADGWYERFKEIPELDIEEMKQTRQNTINKLPDDVYHQRERKYRWYFYLGGYCTKYAKLFNYPEDIKPDWLAGIEECKAMLKTDNVCLKPRILR